MSEFAESVIKFLEFNEYKRLEGKGKILKEKADIRDWDETYEKMGNFEYRLIKGIEKNIK